eukprot:NODE_6466_length_325_cov_516.978261_g5313_i0.p3 GENE.NODE_6466_length_325_cov_516.978261_g5313_i0~~NODE_6466_length_325_cov_516.978261_g5313_i0.p3  ORF type:complete len:52 (+),score=5.58 NODE_6466_length_325_cov_516.978261_g5313_i0:52-207(+)
MQYSRVVPNLHLHILVCLSLQRLQAKRLPLAKDGGFSAVVSPSDVWQMLSS